MDKQKDVLQSLYEIQDDLNQVPADHLSGSVSRYFNRALNRLTGLICEGESVVARKLRINGGDKSPLSPEAQGPDV